MKQNKWTAKKKNNTPSSKWSSTKDNHVLDEWYDEDELSSD